MFDIVPEAAIAEGRATDAYFLRTEEALEHADRNPHVVVEVTADQFPTGEFELFAGGLDAAEFRMAFDCLPTLLSAYGRETAFRFLHVVVAQARAVSGLVHFRLPRELDSELVRLFRPLFDATVELRIDGDGLDQRWHFRDRDLTSDWLPLERPSDGV